MAVNFTKSETTEHYMPLDESTKHTHQTKMKNLLGNISKKIESESDQASQCNYHFTDNTMNRGTTRMKSDLALACIFSPDCESL